MAEQQVMTAKPQAAVPKNKEVCFQPQAEVTVHPQPAITAEEPFLKSDSTKSDFQSTDTIKCPAALSNGDEELHQLQNQAAKKMNSHHTERLQCRMKSGN